MFPEWTSIILTLITLHIFECGEAVDIVPSKTITRDICLSKWCNIEIDDGRSKPISCSKQAPIFISWAKYSLAHTKNFTDPNCVDTDVTDPIAKLCGSKPSCRIRATDIADDSNTLCSARTLAIQYLCNDPAKPMPPPLIDQSAKAGNGSQSNVFWGMALPLNMNFGHFN